MNYLTALHLLEHKTYKQALSGRGRGRLEGVVGGCTAMDRWPPRFVLAFALGGCRGGTTGN